MSKPTIKQMIVIEQIEEWVNVKFTGETIKEASFFISKYLDKSIANESIHTLEDECNWYGMPNQ